MTTTTLPDTLSAAYRATRETAEPVEISSEAYYEALEVLPPIYGAATETKVARFWVGEASDTSPSGVAICLECWEERGEGYRQTVGTGRYFCQETECPKYR